MHHNVASYNSNKVNPRHLDILEQQDHTELAKLWCRLNKSQWPKELGGSDNENHDGMLILMWIIDKISYKECLREWNKDTMSNKQFEDWWVEREKNVK